jgi:hypothetical protein
MIGLYGFWVDANMMLVTAEQGLVGHVGRAVSGVHPKVRSQEWRRREQAWTDGLACKGVDA